MSTISFSLLEAWVVNGPGGSGKDAFISFATEYALTTYGISTRNISSIDPCREQSRELYGYDPSDKSEEARRHLIVLKKTWIAQDPEGPTNYLLNSILDSADGLVFFHIREPEEIAHLIERAREEGIAIRTMHVSWPSRPIPDNPIDRGTRGTADNPFLYDREVENGGGIEDLREQAERFVDEIMQRSGIEALHARPIEGVSHRYRV